MTLVTPSILVTDDDDDFRQTLCGVLEPRGFRTMPARTGEEALRILGREEVHLVLMDYHMPRLTGLETFRLARQMRAMLPCILMSARLDEAIREQARRAQILSVLSKPVSRGELTHAVERALTTAYGWK